MLLSYLREHDTIKRTVTVIKTRASRRDPTSRQFVIGPRGIVLDGIPPSHGKQDPGEESPAGATVP